MNYFKNIFKKKVLLTAAVLVAALGIGGAVAVAEFGPNRPTKQYVQNGPGFDQVTFNSFTGVPNIGDERDFLTGKIAGAPDGFYDPMNKVRDGNEILVRVYVHNNADPSLNADGSGVAKNTKVRVDLPTGQAKVQEPKAYISADNAQPQEIFDTLNINADYPFQLDYVEDSAKITTNFMNDQPLSDDIVNGGVLIGDDALDGQLPGCFEYVALVTFKVKVSAPNYNIQKTVRLENETSSQWREQATAEAEDTVEWKLEFTNTGNTKLEDVAIFDQLPDKMSLVPGSTMIYNASNPSGVSAGTDAVVDNGIDVGNYLSNSNAIVVFKAKIAKLEELSCGTTTFLNKGYAKPADQGTVTDEATVIVDKECEENPEPIYRCDAISAPQLVSGSTYKFTTDATAKDGATIKQYNYEFTGDDYRETSVTNNANGEIEHTFPGPGNYAINVKVDFNVDGEVVSDSGEGCKTTLTIPETPGEEPKTPPTTPTTLPDTGVGSVAGLFAGTSAIGAFIHRLLNRRKF